MFVVVNFQFFKTDNQMKIYQSSLYAAAQVADVEIPFDPNMIFVFISPDFDDKEAFITSLSNKYKNATITGCSTAGEILDISVYDKTVALTAVQFEKTAIRLATVSLEGKVSSFEAGDRITTILNGKDLKHMLVFSDGLTVNGAELVNGLKSQLPKEVSITGGLAGDGPNFNKTFVISNGDILQNNIVAVGLYGDALKVGYGSKGGWDSFGVERLVTKSVDNVLYELDGQPALQLYKSFLGEKAKELPGAGLLFPLSMRDTENKIPLTRTILAIDEEAQSLTFAGNIHEGSYVRLMKANIDRLIMGAEQSAQITKKATTESAQLAFLISCVGRRLVMNQLVEEEVEAVRDVLGPDTNITGFYSYGEIAPFDEFSPCKLHNQTMTITTLSE